MWQPNVSVVMCTYNGEKHLKDQLDSIEDQTYPIKEVLIFDDASTDGTAEILKKFAQKNSYTTLHFNTQNVGYNQNFEQALKAAAGEVIAISDQDDYWHPEKIERMINAWDKLKPIIHCDSQRFEGEVPLKPYSKRLYRRFKGTDSKKLFFYNSVSGHAMLVQKIFLPHVLPLEKEIFYDWWMTFVASCSGGVDFLNETLVYQRVHGQNVTVHSNVSKSEMYQKSRSLVRTHLKKFLSVPTIKKEDKQLGQKFYQRLSNNNTFFQKAALFFLIIGNRNIVFYTKKRVVGIFSHIKHAYYLAFY